MSFLSVLKIIGQVIGVGTAIAAPIIPIVETIPGAGTIAGTIFNAVVAVEGLVTNDGTGAQKKAAVTSIVTAAHPSVDPAKLSATIDGIVGALNNLQAILAALQAPKPA